MQFVLRIFDCNNRLCMFIANFVYRGKNNFAKVSKSLDIELKIILLDHQNNYVRMSSMMSNVAKVLTF